MRRLKKVPLWWMMPQKHAMCKDYKLCYDGDTCASLTHDVVNGKDRFSLIYIKNGEEYFYKLTFAEFASFMLETPEEI